MSFIDGKDQRVAKFDFSSNIIQMLVVEVIRVGFYVSILLITAMLSIQQPHFINQDLINPVYGLLICAFLVHYVYINFFDLTLKTWYVKAALFAFDTLLLTALIYHSGVSQSIFLFLFLVNIALCGLIFHIRGAIILALWTSILFSLLLLIGHDEVGQKVIYVLGINNLAFFVVAFLSGVLSEQINFMGSELKERGRDLKVLQDFNKLIVDNITTGIVTIDPQGKIIHFNPSTLTILNKTNNLIGSNITTIFAQFTDYFDKSKEFLVADRIPRRRILHLKSELGEKSILELVTSPLRGGKGEVTGYILLFHDLTEIFRLETEVKQAEKMAAIGQLAAGIAHEIRNPLASISGSVELLFSLLKSQTADEQKLMSIVMKEIDRLNGLISEFLDFVRPEGSVEKVVNLNEVVNNIVDLIKMNKKLNPNVSCNVSLNARKSILGNANKLKQALLNIVINAFQAMEGKSSGYVFISTTDQDDKVILKIRDEGVGMNEGNLKKIFEPFHTTKKSGTGLGLAVTHKIIEVHRAKVFVDSELNKGTEFTIEFPSNHEVIATASTETQEETKELNNVKVLEQTTKLNDSKRGTS